MGNPGIPPQHKYLPPSLSQTGVRARPYSPRRLVPALKMETQSTLFATLKSESLSYAKQISGLPAQNRRPAVPSHSFHPSLLPCLASSLPLLHERRGAPAEPPPPRFPTAQPRSEGGRFVKTSQLPEDLRRQLRAAVGARRHRAPSAPAGRSVPRRARWRGQSAGAAGAGRCQVRAPPRDAAAADPAPSPGRAGRAPRCRPPARRPPARARAPINPTIFSSLISARAAGMCCTKNERVAGAERRAGGGTRREVAGTRLRLAAGAGKAPFFIFKPRGICTFLIPTYAFRGL